MVYCRPGDLAGLATVGNGVEIKKSTIPNSGNGLFATRAFQPKQIITEYCGPIISREEAVHIRQTDPSAISHFRSLGYHQVISGYRHKEEAVGKGGASFANDATKLRRNNAKLCVFEMRYTHQLRVFLVAEKAIAPGEEVFAAYGKDYWKIKPAKTEAPASGSFTDVGRGQRRLTQFNGFASSKAGVSLQGASKAAAGVTRSSAGSGLAASGIPLTLS